MPLHLGSFILAHSRRIMNNIILAYDGYKKVRTYYGDTDSVYVPKTFYEHLNQLGYVGGNLCQGKNDYGSGGIVYGLYPAPKIKYNIVLDDGMLYEKKTFNGNTKRYIKGEDIVDLRRWLLKNYLNHGLKILEKV